MSHNPLEKAVHTSGGHAMLHKIAHESMKAGSQAISSAGGILAAGALTAGASALASVAIPGLLIFGGIALVASLFDD